MQDVFFTSKQAGQIAGCTLRQLQYWREKEVIVPTIISTGTGRSVYYSRSEVMELALMIYCLEAGLNFEIAAATVKHLKDKELILPVVSEEVPRRFMLGWDEKLDKLELSEFDQEKAIAILEKGKPVIPIYLDDIYQKLAAKLG
ncbi:MAG: MerR family transcriptional regulator [Richelia sp. RM2_1_2]|nr:MerR family transcriptional regulator [Richelia sp. RM1_1_1]NJO62823.1 MerR family transcriptional regulator [Richelia sp. RM2_1_2]